MAKEDSTNRVRPRGLPTARINSEAEGQELTIWDYTFTWTSEHPNVDDIRGLLYSYDKLATDALDSLDKYSSPAEQEGCPHGGNGKKDIYELLKEHAGDDAVLGELWNHVTQVPDWVDWDQIARGQQVVHQYGTQALLGLLVKSLVGGMGAWRVVETLARTGGFGIKVTRRRLLETLQHFLEVMEDLDSVKPGGKGFVSSVRVRLLHATVRRRIMRLERERPGYFDQQAWGVPINDLHQMGTVSVYSAALIWEAFPRQGIVLTPQQTADYLALWRWIGHVLGTPVHWMDTPSRAKAVSEAIMVSEFEPSRTSQIIANNILTSQTNVPPLYARREYLAALTYRLNGNDLSTAMAIERPSVYWRALVWVQCLFLICMGQLYPWMTASQRERRRKYLLDTGYKMITSQKNGGLGAATNYEFQYVPQFGKLTEMATIPSGKVLASTHVKIWLSCVLVGLLAVASSLWYLHRTTDGALWEAVGDVVEQGSSIWRSWETLSVS